MPHSLLTRHFDDVVDLALDQLQDGALAIRVRGACMERSIRDGERVTIVRRRLLLPGDVVVFRTLSSLVAHRVLGWAVRERSFGVVTRGDHCARHDGIVSSENILGTVAGTRVTISERLKAFRQYLALVLDRRAKGR